MNAQMENVINCPLCGHGASFYRESAGIKVDKCGECGVIYQNPRMTKEALDLYYSNGTYNRTYSSSLGSQRSRANRILSIIRGMEIFPKRCLDIGCSRGYLLKSLKEDYGAQVLGLEKYINGPVIDEIVQSKEKVTGKFDFILCIQTLEHMYDPQEELRWMVEKLDAGGTIVLELPFQEKIYLPHIYAFNTISARLMLKRLGLEYLYIEYETNGIFLIGEGYNRYKAERVIEIMDSYTMFDGLYR